MEDGTADGKIPRVADGRIVFRDEASGDLVCRDAGNGLLLWRRYLGGPQNGDLAIVADRVYAWYDSQADPANGSTKRETGLLAEFDLASGAVLRSFEQRLRAGTVASVEVPWGGRKRTVEPVPCCRTTNPWRSATICSWPMPQETASGSLYLPAGLTVLVERTI